MTNDFWFKKKRYGWGWTPANAKGWAVLLLHSFAVCIYPLSAAAGWYRFSMPLFFAITFVLTAGLVVICYKKGETPRWSWGDEN